MTSAKLTDDTRQNWLGMLARPGALIIDGNLYFVGPEPTAIELAADPKRYGCYGTRFLIGHDDGTQTVTHNLGCCGQIPAELRPADNAAFLGVPQRTPLAAPPVHTHFDHLDYIGGSHPYECVVCGNRYAADEVPEEIADAVFDTLAVRVR